MTYRQLLISALKVCSWQDLELAKMLEVTREWEKALFFSRGGGEGGYHREKLVLQTWEESRRASFPKSPSSITLTPKTSLPPKKGGRRRKTDLAREKDGGRKRPEETGGAAAAAAQHLSPQQPSQAGPEWSSGVSWEAGGTRQALGEARGGGGSGEGLPCPAP